MLGDHGVAESLVEPEIARKLPADADSDLREFVGAGIVVDPRHQRRPDALALLGGINGDSPHMKDAGLTIEPQAADSASVD